MTETPPTGVRRVLLDSGYAFTAFLIALPAFVLVVAAGGSGLDRIPASAGSRPYPSAA